MARVVGLLGAMLVFAAAWIVGQRYDLRTATGDGSVLIAWRLDRLTGEICRVRLLGALNQPTEFETNCVTP